MRLPWVVAALARVLRGQVFAHGHQGAIPGIRVREGFRRRQAGGGTIRTSQRDKRRPHFPHMPF